jgi:hypothetical protein
MNSQNNGNQSIFLQAVTAAASCVDLVTKHNLVMTYHGKSIPEVIRYDRTNVGIKFWYGPPEYHVEMSLIKKSANGEEREYLLSDLFAIPQISEWMMENRLVTRQKSKLLELTDAINWYCTLLDTCCADVFKKYIEIFEKIDKAKEKIKV